MELPSTPFNYVETRRLWLNIWTLHGQMYGWTKERNGETVGVSLTPVRHHLEL